MKPIFVLVFLIFGKVNINAQQYWSKTFEIAPAREQVWQMAFLEGSIYMSAISNCKGDGYACNVLVKLDSDGKILKSNILKSDGNQFYPSGSPAFSISSNHLLQTFNSDFYTDTFSTYLFYLGKNDLEVDTFFISYPINYDVYNGLGHIKLNNGYTLEYGQEYHTVTKRSLTSLHYRDANGGKGWQRIIGEQYLFNLMGGNLIEISSNKIAGISLSCTGCEYPTMKPYVFAVDTLGELVFDLYLDTMISDINRGQRPLIAPYDSTSFVIVWYQQDKDGFDNNPYIARIGQDGALYWRTVLPLLDPSTDVRYIHQIIRAKNGDYIIAGERFGDHIMPNSGVLDLGCALRISPEGEVIWDRVYHEPDVKFPQRQFFWNVAEDDDENLYFSGEVQDSVVDVVSDERNTNFWLVKVGPDGCIEPGCTEQVILLPTEETFRILPENYLRVYPNPVRDDLQVFWKELPAGEAFMSAHDISGRLLGTWPVQEATGALSLDVRSWPAGMAFLSLRSAHWMTLPVKVVVENNLGK